MADTAQRAQPAPAPAPSTTVQLSIEKIYVKDLSLENPGAPQSFQIAEAPQVEIGLRTRAEQVDPDVYECVLTVTVTASVGRQDAVPGRGRAGRASSRSAACRRTSCSRCSRSTARRCCSRTCARRSPTRRCARAFRRCISRRSTSRCSTSSSSRRRISRQRPPSRTDARTLRSVARRLRDRVRSHCAGAAAACRRGAADFRATGRRSRRPLRRAVGEGEAAVRLRARRSGRDARHASKAGRRSATRRGTIGWIEPQGARRQADGRRARAARRRSRGADDAAPRRLPRRAQRAAGARRIGGVAVDDGDARLGQGPAPRRRRRASCDRAGVRALARALRPADRR